MSKDASDSTLNQLQSTFLVWYYRVTGIRNHVLDGATLPANIDPEVVADLSTVAGKQRAVTWTEEFREPLEHLDLFYGELTQSTRDPRIRENFIDAIASSRSLYGILEMRRKMATDSPGPGT